MYECLCYFFFFKQKTAYEMRISDWSSDVCSSDLPARKERHGRRGVEQQAQGRRPRRIRLPGHVGRKAGFGEAQFLPNLGIAQPADDLEGLAQLDPVLDEDAPTVELLARADRKSTRLNSSH